MLIKSIKEERDEVWFNCPKCNDVVHVERGINKVMHPIYGESVIKGAEIRHKDQCVKEMKSIDVGEEPGEPLLK